MREALLSAAALCALVTLLPGAVTWKVGTAPSPPSRTELRKMMAAGEMVNGVKPWKLGDTDEYVIVLRLEGANFPAVRKRFGFKADQSNQHEHSVFNVKHATGVKELQRQEKFIEHPGQEGRGIVGEDHIDRDR